MIFMWFLRVFFLCFCLFYESFAQPSLESGAEAAASCSVMESVWIFKVRELISTDPRHAIWTMSKTAVCSKKTKQKNKWNECSHSTSCAYIYWPWRTGPSRRGCGGSTLQAPSPPQTIQRKRQTPRGGEGSNSKCTGERDDSLVLGDCESDRTEQGWLEGVV